MTLSSALFYYQVISKIEFSNGEDKINKDLSLKIMNMRLALAKINKNFLEENQKYVDERKPDWFEPLRRKEVKTKSEEKKINDEISAINAESAAFAEKMLNEKVDFNIDDNKFTEDEYIEIFNINFAGKEVDVNNKKISRSDLLEMIHDIFV